MWPEDKSPRRKLPDICPAAHKKDKGQGEWEREYV